jgi:hypothetical protein
MRLRQCSWYDAFLFYGATLQATALRQEPRIRSNVTPMRRGPPSSATNLKPRCFAPIVRVQTGEGK